MTTLKVVPVTAVDDLFHAEPGRGTVQPCHLSLNLDTGDMTCGYDPSVDPGWYPMLVRHQVVLWVPIPCLTPTTANELMETVTPLAEQILADSAVDWDGSNVVGTLYEGAAAALAEMVAGCDPANDWPQHQLIAPIAAADWYADEGPSVAARLGITATTTDAELRLLAEGEEAQAAVIGPYGHTVLVDALPYLTGTRDALAVGADQ